LRLLQAADSPKRPLKKRCFGLFCAGGGCRGVRGRQEQAIFQRFFSLKPLCSKRKQLSIYANFKETHTMWHRKSLGSAGKQPIAVTAAAHRLARLMTT
jgi:hypothetical protein